MATLQEIEAKKQEIHSKGIAKFIINGLNEDESIARIIDESWSFFYVCVKDPYFAMKGKAGNMRFRLFQTLKDKPQIPMGYSGMPLFSFDCFDGKPTQKAIEILKTKVKSQYHYTTNNNEITCKRIIPDSEKKPKLEPIRDAQIGDILFANWTSCGYQMKGKSKVITVNRATFVVELLEEIKVKTIYNNFMTWPEGQKLSIPRSKPTQYNCLTKQ